MDRLAEEPDTIPTEVGQDPDTKVLHSPEPEEEDTASRTAIAKLKDQIIACSKKHGGNPAMLSSVLFIHQRFVEKQACDRRARKS